MGRFMWSLGRFVSRTLEDITAKEGLPKFIFEFYKRPRTTREFELPQNKLKTSNVSTSLLQTDILLCNKNVILTCRKDAFRQV